jgi:hypothetical protein
MAGKFEISFTAHSYSSGNLAIIAQELSTPDPFER